MMNVTSTANNDWYKANYRYLMASALRVRQVLKNHLDSKQNQPTPDQWKESAALYEDAASTTVAPTRLDLLCATFSLKPIERDILLLCVAMEIIPNLKLLCAKVHKNLAYPTFTLAYQIFENFEWSIVSNQSPLQYFSLIEIGLGLSLSESQLRLDKRILCYLLGEPSSDEKLQGIVNKIPLVATTNPQLQPSHKNLVEQLVSIWSTSETSDAPIVQLCAIESAISNIIAATTCYRLGCNLHSIKVNNLPTNPNDLNYILRRWEREALLSNSALLLDCHDVNIADTAKLSAIKQLIENISSRLIITSRERLPLTQETYLTFDVPKLTTNEQLAIWQDALGASSVELNGTIETLVSQFNLTSQRIYTAVSTAKGIINTNSVSATDTNKEATALWDSCRIMARPQLDDLASRINTNATWDDLVLLEQQQQLLREMIIHVQHRLTVYEKWGFANKSDRGLGIAALFSGISGTGKTMSAEVIANELRLDLYRIDLSAVVSKYIGETEKNLRRIFDAAEAGGAVLLFDEADALFSKRTEVKDSHDRNANLETNYLLQRLEAYQGLAILTTNLRNSIDSAFMRRIRFVVEFEFPTPEIREQIWQQVFPKDTPILELDYAKLARLNVPGGNIRSIAMNAAFLAAATAEPVQMKHLLSATLSEGRKTGLSLGNHTKGWV